MLARRVAAAIDVGTLLALRAEIVDLLIAMPETIKWRPLRKHAHALRWHAELIVGELLILMKARGERERGGGYFRGRSKPTRKSLGLTRGTAWRWQARARAAPTRSFNVRIVEATTIAELKALTDELDRAARFSKRDDVADRAQFRAARMGAERKGGLLPIGKTEVGVVVARRWRRFAAMDEAAFTALVASGEVVKSSSKAHPPAPQVAMLISDWAPDEFGLLSRTVTAVAIDAGNRQMAAAE